MNFHPVDIILVVYLLLASLHGLRRGLSSEIAHMVAAVAILAAAWIFSPQLADLLMSRTRLQDPGMAHGLSFALVIAGGFVLSLLLRLILKTLLDFSFKGRLERLGGALAGCLRGVVVVTVVVIAINLWPRGYFYEQVAEASFLGRNLSQAVMPLYEALATERPEWGLPPPHVDPAEPETGS